MHTALTICLSTDPLTCEVKMLHKEQPFISSLGNPFWWMPHSHRKVQLLFTLTIRWPWCTSEYDQKYPSLLAKRNLWIILHQVRASSQVARWGKKKIASCHFRRCGFSSWVGKIPWRRAWQPTPGFLPGESHGQRSLAGCGPGGLRESGTTEQLSMHVREASLSRVQFWTRILLENVVLWDRGSPPPPTMGGRGHREVLVGTNAWKVTREKMRSAQKMPPSAVYEYCICSRGVFLLSPFACECFSLLKRIRQISQCQKPSHSPGEMFHVTMCRVRKDQVWNIHMLFYRKKVTSWKQRESEQTLRVGDGQGGLACCSPWGRKESDTTEWVNWMIWRLMTPQHNQVLGLKKKRYRTSLVVQRLGHHTSSAQLWVQFPGWGIKILHVIKHDQKVKKFFFSLEDAE